VCVAQQGEFKNTTHKFRGDPCQQKYTKKWRENTFFLSFSLLLPFLLFSAGSLHEELKNTSISFTNETGKPPKKHLERR
jgi:hypothetical protein